MKMIKKILALSIAVMLITATSLSAFAAGSYSPIIIIEIRTGNFTGSGDIMLNCYTSGAVNSGTLVSTWARTSNQSQLWYFQQEYNGRNSLRSSANHDVAINANRSYIGTSVNVLKVNDNNILDCTFISTPGEYVNGGFVMAARMGHVNSVYITRNGNANICTWQYNNGSSNQKWQWSET